MHGACESSCLQCKASHISESEAVHEGHLPWKRMSSEIQGKSVATVALSEDPEPGSLHLRSHNNIPQTAGDLCAAPDHEQPREVAA